MTVFQGEVVDGSLRRRSFLVCVSLSPVGGGVPKNLGGSHINVSQKYNLITMLVTIARAS